MSSVESNTKVLDESFEVHSFALSRRSKKYERILDLTGQLYNKPEVDDCICAANCILMLASRLDICRQTRDSLAAELRELKARSGYDKY